MNELEITWPRVVRVWWLLLWRGLLGGVVLGALAGFLIGFGGVNFGAWTVQTITAVASGAGYLVGLVWALIVVRMALKKRYSEFRLALLPQPAT
jgi:hypothetical protein